MKLNPDALVVSSFETSPSTALQGMGDDSDPTRLTWCYVCPVKTQACTSGLA